MGTTFWEKHLKFQMVVENPRGKNISITKCSLFKESLKSVIGLHIQKSPCFVSFLN